MDTWKQVHTQLQQNHLVLLTGVYYSSAIAENRKNIPIVNTNYGYKVELDDNSVLIDKATGLTKNNTNNLNFTIGYNGYFENPKITVALYRRKYDNVYSSEYELVNLRDYVTNSLTTSVNENEYLVTNSIQATQNFILNLKNTGLTTGTYKVVFNLYNFNTSDSTHTLITKMEKPIIIK